MRLVALVLVLAACGDEALPIAELQDPATCADCHQQHYKEWSGSMHAYASDDPVFVAMNKRGQAATGGKLGTFCVSCHAPMAVAMNLTDGSNFDPDALPPEARGITCYFCHNVKDVTTTHNNGLVLANDQTMRGGLKDPVDTPAHRSSYSKLMDSNANESEMCGSCHDIVVPPEIHGGPEPVALERTFAEWQETFFATIKDPTFHNTCGSCHMRSRSDVVADKPGLDVPLRKNGFHDHMFPGIDKASTPFPEREAQAIAVQSLLDQSINIIGALPRTGPPIPGGICVEPNRITVRVDSIGTGHSWPSGAAQDRRSWLELIAYDASNNIVYQSGVVPEGMDPEQVGNPAACKFDPPFLARAPEPPQAVTDPLCGFWDRTFKADNSPSHFFWDVVRVQSVLLGGPTTRDPNDPAFDHSRRMIFEFGATSTIERVTARFRFRPLPFALLDDLIAGGELAAGIRGENKTLEVGVARTWLKATRDPITFCGPP